MSGGSRRKAAPDERVVGFPAVVHDLHVTPGGVEWGNGMTERSVAPRTGTVAPAALSPEHLRILLVEDDEGDAFLVRELLDEAGAPFELIVARSLREARGLTRGIHCV